MNWKICAVCVGLALSGWNVGAIAQQATPPGRHIPAEAQKAILEFPGNGSVTLNGKPIRLSAAVQIRGTNNLIVLSESLQGKYLVRALLDNAGALHRAWIIDGNP
ncbi:MAG: hypothetical protein JWN23_471 [Rhodocyclales bacterium]|nr:hypothetical protein [Rhodocyclales bacterium]